MSCWSEGTQRENTSVLGSSSLLSFAQAGQAAAPKPVSGSLSCPGLPDPTSNFGTEDQSLSAQQTLFGGEVLKQLKRGAWLVYVPVSH